MPGQHYFKPTPGHGFSADLTVTETSSHERYRTKSVRPSEERKVFAETRLRLPNADEILTRERAKQ